MFALLLIGSLTVGQISNLNTIYESQAYVDKVRSTWPPSDSPLLNRLKTSPRVIFYTDRSRPKVFSADESGTSFIAARETTAPDPVRIHHINFEFPFRATAGMDIPERDGGPETVKLLEIPENGQIITFLREDHSYQRASFWDWLYPPGTVSMEILYQRFTDGEELPFEVRARVRQKNGTWKSFVYRPFPDRQSLSDAVQTLWLDWQEMPDLDRLVKHCESEESGELKQLRDYIGNMVYKSDGQSTTNKTKIGKNNLAYRLLDRYALVDTLPPIKPEHSKKLLRNTKFKDMTGLTWVMDEHSEGHAPTAATGDNVVPNGYTGAFTNIRTSDCRECHGQINRDVRSFTPFWRGNIRGGDALAKTGAGGVFSFMPWSDRMLKGATSNRLPQLDPRLIRAGVVSFGRAPRFDPAFD
jgi:hypothetical protein